MGTCGLRRPGGRRPRKIVRCQLAEPQAAHFCTAARFIYRGSLGLQGTHSNQPDTMKCKYFEWEGILPPQVPCFASSAIGARMRVARTENSAVHAAAARYSGRSGRFGVHTRLTGWCVHHCGGTQKATLTPARRMSAIQKHHRLACPSPDKSRCKWHVMNWKAKCVEGAS